MGQEGGAKDKNQSLILKDGEAAENVSRLHHPQPWWAER